MAHGTISKRENGRERGSKDKRELKKKHESLSTNL